MSFHTTAYRVYYEDTDAGGIVYHTNYLKFAERARKEWLRSLGFDQSKLMLEEQILLPVYHLEVKYLLPARLDDLLSVETRLLKLGKVSINLSQEIKCAQKTMAILDVSIASVDAQIKPKAIPQALYEVLSKDK